MNSTRPFDRWQVPRNPRKMRGWQTGVTWCLDGSTRRVFNPAVALLTGAGLSFWGSRILQVRGRKTGEIRETPVNLLTHQGSRYLVAPRGETQWVRNLRVAGVGALRLGRKT